jgi:hypothetical protein
VAAHDDLRFARVDHGQRPGQARHRQLREAERVRAGDVRAQDEAIAAGAQHVGLATPGQAHRVRRAERRGRRHDRTVDQVGRRRHDLRIDLGAPGHHRARGWKVRYMRCSAELGRCV